MLARVNRVRAVIFDLGNVLAFHDNALLFRRFGERAGLSEAQVRSRWGPALWDRVNRGALGGGALQEELCRRLNLRIEEDEFFALWSCHFTFNDALLPHVEALVGKVRLLLLSNTNHLHARYLLPRLPVLARFDALLLSHELGLIKPEQEIFEEALRRAGTAPAEAAFFDDSPEFVAAARALGIRAAVFAQTRDFPAQLEELGL